jgi:hypothetical protein
MRPVPGLTPPRPPRPSCRWALPGGGCTDLSLSSDGATVAAICGGTLFALSAASGGTAQLMPAACSAAIDRRGALWVSRAAVSPGRGCAAGAAG